MLSYNKLWILLDVKGMKKTDLKAIMSGSTLAKLGKNETVSSAVIENICKFLDCQPGEIMEYISEERALEITRQMDMATNSLMHTLKEKGVTKEQFAQLMQMAMPGIIESMYNGEETITNLMQKGIEESNQE